MLQCDNPFWTFSLAVYDAPGVAAECIALQDTLGADVNVLLFFAWLGAVHGRALTVEDLAAIEAAVQPWRDTAIRPLRAVRRDIKTMTGSADETIAALRKDVAALELRAEQIEQAMLYRLMPTLGAPLAETTAEAIRRNVSAFLARTAPAPSEVSAPRLIEAALAHASRQ